MLPGSVLSEPAVTSYGFCLATDARNLMGYSSNGQLLWEKNIGRVRNLSLTSLKGDFILFHDETKNILRLFNPSGKEIWAKPLDFKLFSRPFAGRDGRFFIHGEGQLLCYGINGVLRWKLETESQKELPIQELPDGSIILFLSDINGHTRGLRISPFGQMLENITFAGSIKSTETCRDGVLLSKTEITVYKLNSKDGSVLQSRSISGIDGTGLVKSAFSEAGLFIADSSNALLIGYDLQDIWSAKMPDTIKKKTVNQIIYLKDDYLVFCGKNWSLNAYHTSQTTNSNQSVQKNIQSDYSSFAPLDLNEINYYGMGSFSNSIKDSKTGRGIAFSMSFCCKALFNGCRLF